MQKLVIYCPQIEYLSKAEALAAKLNLPLQTAAPLADEHFALTYYANGLALHSPNPEFKKPLLIDFADGKHEFRRKQGGGKQQAIAKAIGVKKSKTPSIIDATAGFGSDSFVLASLGCEVIAIERSPIVHALLEDALSRARNTLAIADIAKRIHLHHGDAASLIPTLPAAEVIYLDPMFPHSENSALVKKEMRIIRALVGDDQDNDNLLTVAINHAKSRVVVKRPKLAPFLQQQQPTQQLLGESNRFDVYLIHRQNNA